MQKKVTQDQINRANSLVELYKSEYMQLLVEKSAMLNKIMQYEKEITALDNALFKEQQKYATHFNMMDILNNYKNYITNKKTITCNLISDLQAKINKINISLLENHQTKIVCTNLLNAKITQKMQYDAKLEEKTFESHIIRSVFFS